LVQEINETVLALKKALIERALSGEMSHHLGYATGAAKPQAVQNQRNGIGVKSAYTDDGPLRKTGKLCTLTRERRMPSWGIGRCPNRPRAIDEP